MTRLVGPRHPVIELRRWAVRLIWVGLGIWLVVILLSSPADRAAGRVIRIDGSGLIHLQFSEGGEHAVHLRGVQPHDAAAEPLVAFLRERLVGREVTLVFANGVREAAYVYAGPEMLNEAVLDAGLGRAERYDSHPMRRWFIRIEGWARRDRRGVWQDVLDPPELATERR